MTANIVLNYKDAAEKVYIWANSEKDIDFRKDLEKADRCTVSFAATELMNYLNKINIPAATSEKPQEDSFNIFLLCDGESFEKESFTLTPLEGGIEIHGASRTGVLYGAYEFLRMQGIRWLNPEDDIIPENKGGKIKNIDTQKEFKASMPLGRGFVFEGSLKDSTNLWLWMARNRLNLSAVRPYTVQLQRKLGMSFENGGHIFETLLNPDNKTANGKTFWEEHRDWYGYDDKTKITKEEALKIQFCMSNEGLMDYLAEEIFKLINTDWREADRFWVAVFDSWDRTCQCEKCKKLGNGTDKLLNFVSGLRKRTDKALKENRIDHNIVYSIAVYEGTSSLEPSINPVPQNLRTSGDYIIYYPILRCYKHHIDDESCSYNIDYGRHLRNWKNIPIMIGEYYNVSKFEDMPLLFSRDIRHDIKFYESCGATGLNYMHLPMMAWGVRNITQLLFGQLLWDSDTDVDAFVKQYYKDRYGSYADKLAKAYDLIEDASKYCTSWRSWKSNSILTNLMLWDGRKPQAPLLQDDHLNGNAAKEGNFCVNALQEAYDIIMECFIDNINHTDTTPVTLKAVNPGEIQKMLSTTPITEHLAEDLRLVKYGINMMKIMTLFIEYHEAMFEDAPTENIWKQLDETALNMVQEYMPLNYLNSLDKFELSCRDTLTRSQLKTLYYRCKANRFKQA